nr:MAG TPA: hypothetical protein [Caudoviricetes sp.]
MSQFDAGRPCKKKRGQYDSSGRHNKDTRR